jgi:hypothetical protein
MPKKTSTVDTTPDFEKLLWFLPLFMDPTFKSMINEADDYPEYHPTVGAFCDELAKKCWIDYDYMSRDLTYLNIENANLALLKSYLTSIWRRERFSDGHIASMFENGLVVDILWRLKELRDIAMTDGKKKAAKYINDYMRVARSDNTIEIQVEMIEWPHPHTPTSSWHTIDKLDKFTSQEVIDEIVEKTLSDKRYFKVCNECNERNPVGHMHDNKICQSCAENNHGIVY